MTLLSRTASGAILCVLIDATLRWRDDGGESVGLASAFQLSSPPDYCSKDMSFTEVPCLAKSINQTFNGSVTIADVEMLQVQAVIRHGARAPYTEPQCWAGYDYTWDCNVTEVVASSPDSSGKQWGPGLFRKRYDALPGLNALGGTCAMGQLIDEGYDQEKVNGRHLRDAYVCEDGPWCLFGNSSAADLQAAGALYLRSDDEQRTIMSGQILVSSMLDMSDVVLDWHTGDDALDYIDPNKAICPRLTELSEDAFASPDWANTQQSNQLINETLHTVWDGPVLWWDVLDCLMTTACTGRELPKGMTEALFNNAVAYSTLIDTYLASYNNGAYAKLGMAQFTRDIREYLIEAVNGSASGDSIATDAAAAAAAVAETTLGPKKFILLSAHDTTLINWLTAIAPAAWDSSEWPPYAALAIIEVLRIGAGGAGAAAVGNKMGDYFRFVYNGKVLRLEGCDQDICPISAFLDATQFAVDLSDDAHCLLAADSPPVEQTSSSFSSSQFDTNTTSQTSSPTPTSNFVLKDPPSQPDHKSGSVTGPTESARPASSHSSHGHLAGVMLACFLIGAVVVAVPAAMYLRRFRYDMLREFGPSRRHSYEMT